jgi:hypothetical protein
VIASRAAASVAFARLAVLDAAGVGFEQTVTAKPVRATPGKPR